MKRKNVISGHGEAASNFFPMRIAVLDSDQASSQEYVAFLQKFPQIYEVCDKTYQDFTWLETDGSEFDIILIGECLLAAYKMKLLQIGNARDMPVLVTSADGGIDTIMRTIDDGDGACACLPKPIPESVLERVWTYAYSKRKNKLAQVQKLTDGASREKKPRLKWTGDLKKKAEECVSEAGGIKEAKANDILQRLRAKGIQDRSITTEKVNSYLQKERGRANKNKEGTIEGSTLKTESNQPTGSQPSVVESLDDIYNELPSLDDGVISEDSGMFENYIEDDDIAHDHSNGLLDGDVLEMMMVSETIPSHMPKYEDKEGTRSEHVESTYEMEEHPPMTLPHLNTTNPNQQGLSLPLPVEANTSCTGGGPLFIDYLPDNLFEGLDSIDIGGILEGPSLSLPNERCPVEIIENCTGNDIAHEHSDNLLVVDNNFSVDNYSVDDDLLMPLAAGLQEGEPKG